MAAGDPATQRASLRPASTAASRPTPTGGRSLPAEVVWFCGICPGVVMTAMVADILKIDAAKTGMSIEEVTQRRTLMRLLRPVRGTHCPLPKLRMSG